MLVDEFVYRITSQLGFAPTDEQSAAMMTFARFLACRSDAVMILRGSAGTGKTTLASAFVRALVSLEQKVILLAPTGRAAKVFSRNSGQPAYTIHSVIYRQQQMDAEGGSFGLDFNKYTDTLFLVDESSMIANDSAGSIFGSGRLLDDLVQYVFQGRNCRLLLIGDQAQLPPVGEVESPALAADFMKGYGLQVFQSDLTEVLRQAEESGILWNATLLRDEESRFRSGKQLLPRIRLKGFADIVRVSGEELIEQLTSSYSEVGEDETIVVTRSNKRANIYNQGIRNQVLWREEELCTGDRLMVVKNNYKSPPSQSQDAPSFIANGDRCVVQKVRSVHEMHGFRFAELRVQFPDFDNYELQTLALLDTLTTEAPALTHEQQEQLYNKVMEDYADIPQKRERQKKLKEDKYYSALQVKFAYAVTCHKAQGGQWAHVYIDQGYMTDEMLTEEYIHWLYTAFTRATDKLFLVNWPKEQEQ